MTYRVEPLSEDHDLHRFDCGNEQLSAWLQRQALHARGQGTRTYVLVEESTGSILGYFAIVPHMIAREDAPPRIGRGAPAQIPVILLAKFALDIQVQGQGLGSDLLVEALAMIVEASRIAGGKLIVVDAVDESARAFYEHHDFEAVPGDESRLVMKLSTAAKALGLQWP